jgi:hypothetical protein
VFFKNTCHYIFYFQKDNWGDGFAQIQGKPISDDARLTDQGNSSPRKIFTRSALSPRSAVEESETAETVILRQRWQEQKQQMDKLLEEHKARAGSGGGSQQTCIR